jgi:hypothetical protein
MINDDFVISLREQPIIVPDAKTGDKASGAGHYVQSCAVWGAFWGRSGKLGIMDEEEWTRD